MVRVTGDMVRVTGDIMRVTGNKAQRSRWPFFSDRTGQLPLARGAADASVCGMVNF